MDLAGSLTPETIAAIKRAWADNLVLRFRDQALSDDDLMRFSRQLGELDKAEQCYRLLMHSSRFRSHGIEGLAALQQLRRPGAAASIAISGSTDPKDRHGSHQKPRDRKK